MKRIRHLACVWLMACLPGCGCVGSNGVGAETSPQQKWQMLSLKDYDYELKRDSFSLPEYVRPMQVSVRNGVVANALYLDDSSAVPDKVLTSLRTVDEWFSYIEEGGRKPFFRLDVRYHKELGYPTYLHADIRERVADDEQTVRIQNLSPR